MNPKSFTILGYGRFGAAFADLLIRAGHSVTVFDPNAAVPENLAATTLENALREAHWIVLAMPVAHMRAAMSAVRPLLTSRHSLMDVGSVKVGPCQWMEEIFGAEISHVGTHPLFGPLSLARGELPRRVVLCGSAFHPDTAVAAREIFENLDCEVVQRDAASHDRLMADTHVLAFFIAKALVEMGIGDDLTLAPPSFRGLANMIAAVRGDAGHLFAAIQKENPYAEASRARFVDMLATVHRRLQEESNDQRLSIAEPSEPTR
jgi:prephenate dehydrogenase